MEYFISVNNSKRGPYTIAELKARGISSATLVMADGTSQWVPAWQVEELRPIIKEAEPANNDTTEEKQTDDSAQNPVPPIQEPVAQPVNDQRIDDFVEGSPIQGKPEPSSQQAPNVGYQQGVPTSPTPPRDYQKRERHGIGCISKFLIFLIIIAAIVGVAVATCPDEAAHKAALANVVSQAVNDEENGSDSIETESDVVDKMFRQISDTWTQKVILTAVDNLITVDNHFVYSTGKVRFGGKEHVVSVGVFGHIFTIDKDDLKKAAEQYYSKAERNVKEDLKKKAADIINDNVIDPAAQAIKELTQSAMDQFMQDMGITDEGTNQQQRESEPTDSTDI